MNMENPKPKEETPKPSEPTEKEVRSPRAIQQLQSLQLLLPTRTWWTEIRMANGRK
jgi:hypothetical protein